MLKLGDKSIIKLMLGDKAITKAYLGDKLVFQSGDTNLLSIFITVDADNAIITLTDFITAFITVDVDNAYIGVENEYDKRI